MATLRASISEIFNAVVIVLMVMAILLSIVGGVGLMGIMELNVLERSREIGVLRAIGATDRRLLIIVLTEGISIGAASWLMGSILAFPLSKWLSDAVGRAVIQTPFSYSYSYWGAGLWLVLILLLSGLSCASPALRASRVTIREALAYE
jgi:putative ABC transport system permease protein